MDVSPALQRGDDGSGMNAGPRRGDARVPSPLRGLMYGCELTQDSVRLANSILGYHLALPRGALFLSFTGHARVQKHG